MVLRTKLEEITQVQDVAQHADLLAEVTKDHPNSIHLLQSPFPIDRYTCVVHAFDFTERAEYLDIAGFGLGRVFANPPFGQWLLDVNILVETTGQTQSEELLTFYFDGEHLKHAGLMQSNGRVISKWGIGQLYEHEVFEVPESYGLSIRTFKRPSYDDAFSYFVRFAEEVHGLRFELVE